jgi:hypothetical protein
MRGTAALPERVTSFHGDQHFDRQARKLGPEQRPPEPG